MPKQIYVSADYSNEDGDTEVVNLLHKWSRDNYHVLEFTDMASVVSGSVVNNTDCRPCDLKAEFNRQINKSSIVVFVVGDKTAQRTAGNSCGKAINTYFGFCTPYKNNANGAKPCKDCGYYSMYSGDINPVNSYSFLRHEFEQAKAKGKTIVIFYNSSRYETNWLPSYMKGYENNAFPFWICDSFYGRRPNYSLVKYELGY